MGHHLRVMELAHDRWPSFVEELRFAPPRRFRFDFASKEVMVAIECEGGGYSRQVRCNHCGQLIVRILKSGQIAKVYEGGRHNTGKGAENDMEKYNLAAFLGWTVLRYTGNMIKDGSAILQIEEVVNSRYGKVI